MSPGGSLDIIKMKNIKSENLKFWWLYENFDIFWSDPTDVGQPAGLTKGLKNGWKVGIITFLDTLASSRDSLDIIETKNNKH